MEPLDALGIKRPTRGRILGLARWLGGVGSAGACKAGGAVQAVEERGRYGGEAGIGGRV